MAITIKVNGVDRIDGALKNGLVWQTNFDTYQMPRISNAAHE
jgi:hypothetical protein